MPTKNRVIYQQEGLYAGPAPSSGFHFINKSGILNNQHDYEENFNLLSWINRVTEISYDVEFGRLPVTALGKRGTIANDVLAPPVVNVNFSYWQNGISNEKRLGFYVNHTRLEGSRAGELQYGNSDNVYLLSGFITKNTDRQENELQWPYYYQDCRNLFVPIKKSPGQDLKNQTSGTQVQNIDVVAFGNCYIANYQTRGQIGEVPSCSVDYVCDNAAFYVSGSGVAVPALNTKTNDAYSGIKFNIPNNFQNDYVSVLQPGDITLSLNSYRAATGVNALYGTGYNSSVALGATVGLGLDTTELYIQSYSIDLPIPRQDLNAITHKLPVDRRVVFPIFSTLNLEVLVNDSQSGSFEKLFRNDNEYGAVLQIRNPWNKVGIGSRYELKRAKLNGLSYQSSLGENKVASLSFITELDPDDLSKGLFVSGSLNINNYTQISGCLLQEGTTDYILTENLERLIIQDIAWLF